MTEQNHKFEYFYSAPTDSERQEIYSIKKEYQQKDTRNNKLENLIKLDKRVKNIPLCVAFGLGIIGCLSFGLGLSLVLEWNNLIFGAIVAIVGATLMIIAYPIYKIILLKNKNKYRKQILSLANELLSETNMQNKD